MPELNNYKVNYNGTETIMQLTEKDAERLGGELVGPAHDVQTEDEGGADADAAGTSPAREVRTRARRTS